MARPTSNLRLFVAIYPPEEVAERLVEALEALDLPMHRRTPREQIHMTLQFVGDTPVKDLDRVIESVARSTRGLGAFDLAPRRLMSLPERGRLRLVAAETDDPADMLEMQRRLATRLARRPRHKPGDRFLPHLTLCRFKPPVRHPAVDVPLDDVEPFHVARLMLMRSVLRPEGAEHDVVEVFELDSTP